MKEILKQICDRNKFTFKNHSINLFGYFNAEIIRKDRSGHNVIIEISEPLTISESELETIIFERFNLRKI
jgi:hypothetical protein